MTLVSDDVCESYGCHRLFAHAFFEKGQFLVGRDVCGYIVYDSGGAYDMSSIRCLFSRCGQSTYVVCTLSLSPDLVGVTGLSDRRHGARDYAERLLFQTTRLRRIDHQSAVCQPCSLYRRRSSRRDGLASHILVSQSRKLQERNHVPAHIRASSSGRKLGDQASGRSTMFRASCPQ